MPGCYPEVSLVGCGGSIPPLSANLGVNEVGSQRQYEKIWILSGTKYVICEAYNGLYQIYKYIDENTLVNVNPAIFYRTVNDATNALTKPLFKGSVDIV